WVMAMNQYRDGGKGADQQFFLSAWSGATVTVDRKATHDQGPLRVRNPFLSVVGGLTPDKLPTLRGDRPRPKVEPARFFDRILRAYPAEAPVVAEDWAEVQEERIRDLADVLAKLRGLAMVPEDEGAGGKGWRPVVVNLTACGRDAWVRFTQAHADERNAD